jgi:hypothetical protein
MSNSLDPNWENVNPLFENDEIEELLRNFVEQDESEVECECGSEVVYGSNCTHSNWCPKSESK